MKVLVVCSGNAHRSPMAKASLKKLKPEIEIDSAGTHSAILTSGAAEKYLTKEKAQKHLKQVPESLGKKKLDEYDIAVPREQKHKGIVVGKRS